MRGPDQADRIRSCGGMYSKQGPAVRALSGRRIRANACAAYFSRYISGTAEWNRSRVLDWSFAASMLPDHKFAIGEVIEQLPALYAGLRGAASGQRLLVDALELREADGRQLSGGEKRARREQRREQERQLQGVDLRFGVVIDERVRHLAVEPGLLRALADLARRHEADLPGQRHVYLLLSLG